MSGGIQGRRFRIGIDINGTLLTGSTVGKDGTVSISLGGLASGLYVIATTEGKSYKIIKR